MCILLSGTALGVEFKEGKYVEKQKDIAWRGKS